MNTNVKLDPELKEEFAEICENLGMSMSTAFTIFVKAVVRTNGIPFSLNNDDELDEYIANNRNYIQKGIEQSKNGQYVEVNDIDEYFKKFKT